MQICLTGMIASGKSTLSDNLTKKLAYNNVNESRLGLQYLDRLSLDPKRWGFETQIAFLIDKAKGIMEKHSIGKPFIVDRSIEEDAKIFYQYFKEKHSVDALSNETYSSLYQLFDGILPGVSLRIICIADKSTIIDRIKNRDKYTPRISGYIDNVFNKYNDYISTLRGQPNTYICDSVHNDWRIEHISDMVAEDLNSLVIHYGAVNNIGLKILKEFK